MEYYNNKLIIIIIVYNKLMSVNLAVKLYELHSYVLVLKTYEGVLREERYSKEDKDNGERHCVLDKNYLIMLFPLSGPLSDTVHATPRYIEDHCKQMRHKDNKVFLEKGNSM